MTGVHAHPWTAAALAADGFEAVKPLGPRRLARIMVGLSRLVSQSPVGSLSGSGSAGSPTAGLPPQRSPEASAGEGSDAAGSPTPQLQMQWATPANYFPAGTTAPGSSVDVVSDGVVDEGVAPHSLIRRAAPACFVRIPDSYDDAADVDKGDSWLDIVNGVRSPLLAAAHLGTRRVTGGVS